MIQVYSFQLQQNEEDHMKSNPRLSRLKTIAPLPKIQVNGRKLRDISKDALYALVNANSPQIYFVRGGSLVRLRIDENNLPFLEAVNESILIGRLARVADFYQIDERRGITNCDPPARVAKDIIAKGLWSLPPIKGIVEAPIIRPNGSIMLEPGYDRQTSLYYFPAPGFLIEPVPDRPSVEQVQRAKELLLEMIQDFPFVDASSKANMLALIITPLVRPAIEGSIPLALIDAPQAGTGKTILGTIVAQIATGHDPSMLPYSQETEEMRKKITSALRANSNVIVMDNITLPLDSEMLASALTVTIWGDRLLGRNEILRLPQQATWIANGNNIRVGGDLPRRCFPIRLDAKMSRPWERSEFHYHDIVEWVKAMRAKLMWSVFILVRAWVTAGKPEFTEITLGGFNSWVGTVGGILSHAGIEGFLANIETLYDFVDEAGIQWETLLLGLKEYFHDEWFTTANLCDALPDNPLLVYALPEDLGSPFRFDGSIANGFNQKLGIEFRKRIGTRFGTKQLYLERKRDTHLKIAKWHVTSGNAGTRGTTDTAPKKHVSQFEPEEKAPALPAIPADSTS